MHEACIGDFRAAETELPELGQPMQMWQARVGNISPSEEETSQAGQPCQERQANIRNMRLLEVEAPKFAGCSQMWHSSIGEAGSAKTQ